jgi:UDP-N-acetylglucosamine 1-carboxyvinyltransferase
MIAAAATAGTTVIRNAAREPENVDLQDFLIKMGASISGTGTPVIRIQGVKSLHGAEHRVIPDRIEAGTLLIACAAAGGELRLVGARADHLKAVLQSLTKSGAKIREVEDGLLIRASGRPRPVTVATRPYPGFPTDLQAPWLAYMCLARGRSYLRENLFEKRFLHAAELRRMGAWVRVDGDQAVIEGVPYLEGAPIMASDIRAGAALVVAALAARGMTTIQRVYHIDRGYERLEEKLRQAGAHVRRVHNLASLQPTHP